MGVMKELKSLADMKDGLNNARKRRLRISRKRTPELIGFNRNCLNCTYGICGECNVFIKNI